MEQLFVFSVFLNLVVAVAFRNDPAALDEGDIMNVMADIYEQAYVEEMVSPRTQTQVQESIRRAWATTTWFD